MLRWILPLCVAVSLGAGCAPSETIVPSPDDAAPTMGSISSRECQFDGTGWLANAQVYINIFDERGVVTSLRQTKTNAEGYWTLPGLPGDTMHTVYTQIGTDIRSEDYFLPSGDDLVISPEGCLPEDGLKIAVITGDYDDATTALERLGIRSARMVDGSDQAALLSFLTDPDALAAYDVLFLGGGVREDGVFYSDDATNQDVRMVQSYLKTYVEEGGHLIASDLSYDAVELLWPAPINFAGDDTVPNAAEVGPITSVVANITDPGLAERLGADTMPVAFDLPSWPVIDDVNPYVSVHLTATFESVDDDFERTDTPLALSFSDGFGRVSFTSFRLDANPTPEVATLFRHIAYDIRN